MSWPSRGGCRRRAASRRSRPRWRRRWRRRGPRNFHIPAERSAPRRVRRAGTDCIEAIFEFETDFGRANGVVRLVEDPADGAWRAWTLLTTLEELHGYPDGRPPAPERRRALLARFRWRELARPAPQGGDLRRSRSGRAGGGRRPGRARRRGPAQCARRRHADRRPQRAHRRQLAPALPRAHPAQRSARQSPAADALSADLAGLHSQGQAGQLVRILCRQSRPELLDRDGAGRRQLRFAGNGAGR